MIDFIKLEIVESNAEQLEQNPLLNFESHINKKTKKQCKCRHAFYNGLIFRITEPKKKSAKKEIIIEGSLHKYYNNGEHNFDDFTIPKIIEAISRLEQEFGFSRFKMLIKEIGIGVNINPPYNSRTIMNGIISFDGFKFDWLHSNGVGFYRSIESESVNINFYDKRRFYSENGYELTSEIMRFELELIDIEQLNELGICFISDLLDGILPTMINLLKFTWSKIKFFDLTTCRWTDRGNNECSQSEIESIARENTLNLFLLDHDPDMESDKIYNEIIELIIEKAEFLCKDTMEYTFSPS